MKFPVNPVPHVMDLGTNFLTSQWVEIETWLKGQLAQKVEALSSPSCDDRETQMLRGEIRFIKKMVSQRRYAAMPKVAHVPDYSD